MGGRASAGGWSARRPLTQPPSLQLSLSQLAASPRSPAQRRAAKPCSQQPEGSEPSSVQTVSVSRLRPGPRRSVCPASIQAPDFCGAFDFTSLRVLG